MLLIAHMFVFFVPSLFFHMRAKWNSKAVKYHLGCEFSSCGLGFMLETHDCQFPFQF